MNTQFELFRKDLDRIFDGTEQQPGVLRMLDRHNEIADLLRERLPPPETKDWRPAVSLRRNPQN